MTENEAQAFYEQLLTNMGLGMGVGHTSKLVYGDEYYDTLKREPFDYTATGQPKDRRLNRKLKRNPRYIPVLHDRRHDNHSNAISPQCRAAVIEATKARRQAPTCGHPDRRCHGLGMCNACYRRKRRADKGIPPRNRRDRKSGLYWTQNADSNHKRQSDSPPDGIALLRTETRQPQPSM
jgi:hypothetical protein